TEKFLRIFTEVRPGEGTTALMMFANVFLILLAYYCIKPIREGWIAVSDIEGLTKMEVKAYSSFAQSIFLLFIVGWYGRLAGHLLRSTLITRVTLFCISNMIIFWFLQPDLFVKNLPYTGIIFYLWVGMFGVFIVAQFWTFCADIYAEERGKRLIPMIAIGATSGAAAGSWLVDQLLGSGLVPTEALLLVATIPLFASTVLTRLVDNRESKPSSPGQETPVKSSKKPAEEGLRFLLSGARLIFISRFLLAAALVTLLTNWVNTNGENLLFRVIQETLASQATDQGITDPAAILAFTRSGTTQFYGNFFFWVNIAALLLQSLVASRLLKFGGFAAIAMLLPVIAMISYSVMALLPILAVVKMLKIAENASDYSINNTARNVLWLPVSSEMKFQGKPAIDTLYVRIGDGLAALTVLIGVQMLTLTTSQFFIFNVVLVVAWLGFTVMLIREYRKAGKDNESTQGC
ncbi:MAG: Npt1/Npt2 family nucleotide transporter, partial [Thermodesulfobacteriota bacterium]|nr:Npt1/Npt2 family nucleotide transporter [Thermodesulfobacteriota bacterium]